MKNESWLDELLNQRPLFIEVFEEYINVIKRERNAGDNVELLKNLFYIEEELEWDMKSFFKYQAAKDNFDDLRTWIDDIIDLDSKADEAAAAFFFMGVAQCCFEKLGARSDDF